MRGHNIYIFIQNLEKTHFMLSDAGKDCKHGLVLEFEGFSLYRLFLFYDLGPCLMYEIRS